MVVVYERENGMLNFAVEDIIIYILVFVRFSGMFFLNPILSRRNIPARFRIALILALTVILAPTLDKAGLTIGTDIGLLFAIFYELVVGVLFNYIFQLFYYMLFFAGDMLDFQFGLSMAKVFDPGTNIQMSVTGNLLSIMFILYFFANDCHLILIKIMASSYDLIPPGTMVISQNIIGYGVELFLLVFAMIVKLLAPFVAVEFIIEIAMGILMKLIPQIHVFVINIQFKLLLAFILLLVMLQPMSEFLDKYLDSMFVAAREIFTVMGMSG